MTLRVVLYGESDQFGTGAWCYRETLTDMGNDVVRASDAAGLEQYGRSLTLRAVRKLVHGPLEWHRRVHAAKLRETVSQVRPQIVIVLKGLYLSAADVDYLRGQGAWVVNINHDDFFSRNRNNWTPVQRRALPFYDYLFTTREVNVEEVKLFNPRVEFFPFAYYPRIHRPVDCPPNERPLWDVDVAFVGTWERHRCEMLEQLVRRVPARYGIWGEAWERVPSSSPLVSFIHAQGGVFGDDMCKALGCAKVALGFLRKENRDEYTQRTFEIPACGGVLLAERTPRHQSLYREGVEAEFFDPNSIDELVAKVSDLLRDTERRESIRRAGRQALLAQAHTYEDRLKRLFELYQAHSSEMSNGRPAMLQPGVTVGRCKRITQGHQQARTAFRCFVQL